MRLIGVETNREYLELRFQTLQRNVDRLEKSINGLPVKVQHLSDKLDYMNTQIQQANENSAPKKWTRAERMMGAAGIVSILGTVTTIIVAMSGAFH